MPYHCMSIDNSARFQPTHYNHYFKEGKRPIAHIIPLPLYPITAQCKQTAVNIKCSKIKKKENNARITHIETALINT